MICDVLSVTGIGWIVTHNPTMSSKILKIIGKNSGPSLVFVVLCGIDLFYLETEEIIVPEKQRTRYTQSLPIFKIEI